MGCCGGYQVRGGMLWRSGEGWNVVEDIMSGVGCCGGYQVRGGMLWRISGEGWNVVENIR